MAFSTPVKQSIKTAGGHISRRSFVKTISAASAATLGANIISCKSKQRKPNLLFIWTDEQATHTMKVYGNDKIKTPNLNKLAEESFVFKNAYDSQPVCTPARSTVMTGLWPTQNTMVKNGNILPKEVECFPEIVNNPEYKTAYMGKWHLGDEQFAQHGFQEWVSMEESNNHSPERKGRKYSDYWHYLKNLGYTPNHTTNLFSRDFAASLPIENCKPKFLERNAIDFLKRHKNEPFILHVNFLEPHMPYFGPLNDMYDPDKVDLPPNFDDPLEEDEPLAYRNTRKRYEEKGGYGFPLKSEKNWRRLIANYWGLVTEVDMSVGAILTALEKFGLDDNTIVVYTSDHGDMMGSHRLLAKDVMYEESAKVPLLMRIPQKGKKQRIIEKPVSHIDLVPTLLDLMDVQTNKEFPGQSLVPLLNGKAVDEDHVFIQWNGFNRTYSNYGHESNQSFQLKTVHDIYIRTVVSPDGWKLSLSDIDKNQLFNLNEDPYETTNLYYSGRHQDIIKRLTEKIYTWQKKIGDKVKV